MSECNGESSSEWWGKMSKRRRKDISKEIFLLEGDDNTRQTICFETVAFWAADEFERLRQSAAAAYEVIAVVIGKVLDDYPVLCVGHVAQRGTLQQQIAVMIYALGAGQLTHFDITWNLCGFELFGR